MFLSTKLVVTHVAPDYFGVTWASFGAAVATAEGGYDRIQAIACRSDITIGITTNNNDLVYSSNHGSTWTMSSASYQAAQGGYCMSLAYGSGPDKFVSTDYNMKWAYSSDGTTWTQVGGTFAGNSYFIGYGNSIFVSVGAAGHCYTSTTGTSWTSNSALDTAWSGTDWWGVMYNGSVWCAIGYIGAFDGIRCCTASDPASTWTQRTDLQTETSSFAATNAFCVIGTTFVVMSGTHIFTSADGIAWTDQATLGNIIATQSLMVSKGDKGLLAGINAANNNNVAYTSTDGVNWTEQTGYDGATWNVTGQIGPNAIGWDGTKFFVCGSTNGSSYINALYSPS